MVGAEVALESDPVKGTATTSASAWLMKSSESQKKLSVRNIVFEALSSFRELMNYQISLYRPA